MKNLFYTSLIILGLSGSLLLSAAQTPVAIHAESNQHVSCPANAVPPPPDPDNPNKPVDWFR